MSNLDPEICRIDDRWTSLTYPENRVIYFQPAAVEWMELNAPAKGMSEHWTVEAVHGIERHRFDFTSQALAEAFIRFVIENG